MLVKYQGSELLVKWALEHSKSLPLELVKAKLS